MQLLATSTATAFAEAWGVQLQFPLWFYLRTRHTIQHFPPENIFTACWALVSRSPHALASRGNPLMREPLSLPVVKQALRIDARFAQRLLKIHFEMLGWTGILNYNIVEVILLCNLLFTPLQRAAKAHECKSTKTLCCQIIHNTADAISSLLLPFILFFFWWNNALCWMHSWPGLMPTGALAAMRVT